ncbi:MAG: hypothetical protein COU10_02410 [Candidatus Harrisonbacteria bacterium CG10_big_fil_rev_8_21_14_0_10_45_28]|uniref:Methyltransferase domain-containing protein n=1 Tax=Candidatus Harrisonbacteria bacterium CG10_big_fil_rev_8_21_14_0_10_45_28 TaxID=1974586 RepID=A0A2H0UQA6_9BACT|nr:MAG: hypothetical protein COU10_02410 [Candidatus Harrisonbacteria bacterium CG10_big_fil_rev_8_21_14_0_10_45_28]
MKNSFHKQKTPYDGPILSWFYTIWRKFNNPRLHNKLTSLAVEKLTLQKGDSVLEIACGPGYSFASLQDTVGKEGHITAIDYSSAMLKQAQKRKDKNDWNNIDLIQKDARTIDYTKSFDGVISILGLSVVPEWERVLDKMIDACKTNKRVVVADSTKGCSIMSAETRNIIGEMKKRLDNVEVVYLLNGLYFVASGVKQ